MKKWITATLASVCMVSACVGFAACETPSKELQMDKKYVYSGISFEKAEDLTLEDLSSFIPPSFTGIEIKTVADFENMLRDNLDTYYITRRTENGIVRIDFKPIIQTIRITKGFAVMEDGYSIWLTYEGETEEECFGATREDDVFTLINNPNQGFYFENGALHYNLELNEKFSVVYNYKMQ